MFPKGPLHRKCNGPLYLLYFHRDVFLVVHRRYYNAETEFRKEKPGKIRKATTDYCIKTVVRWDDAGNQIIPTLFREFSLAYLCPILYPKRHFQLRFSTHYFIYKNFCCRKSCKIACGMVSGGCVVSIWNHSVLHCPCFEPAVTRINIIN